ncbi:LAMI_0E13564g1_1 [Lachancea mirantina]|uniref:LAMI_0E13564g1_1 n=1 Tax=Lachancea mirantina TaxID=1230905 RepID=A0A1G4JQV6_9SACH|nr:LAMI_0E13564g1_1 [Lachancea mirantina]
MAPVNGNEPTSQTKSDSNGKAAQEALNSVTSKDDTQVVRGRPRRIASKRASQLFANMIDPSVAQVDDDEEFRPEPEDTRGDADAEAEKDEENDVELIAEEVSEIANLNETLSPADRVSSLRRKQEPHQITLDAKKPKKTPGKRGRKPKKSVKLEEDIKALTPTSQLDSKRKLVRGLKDLTAARDKIERIYGLDEKKLLGLAKVKEGFEGGPFDFSIENVQPESKYYIDFAPPWKKNNPAGSLRLQKLQMRPLDREDADKFFPKRNEQLNVVLQDTEVEMKTEDKVNFPLFSNGPRPGFLYNTGCLVTDMAWHRKDNDTFLALSLSKFWEDASDPHLGFFSPEIHESSIEIFKVDPASFSFTKVHTILHRFGDSWNLKWHSGYNKPGVLGLLGAVCQDGSVKFWDIKISEDAQILMYENASITISIPEARISCYDYLSDSTIVCGFHNGYMSEFELNSPSRPSFYYKMHDSYVLSIATGYSEYEDTCICTLSVDGYVYAYNRKDVRGSKCTVSRARGGNNTPLVYSPLVYCMTLSDGVNSVKSFPPRAIFATHQICQHDNTVSSLASSHVHPFLLSGSANGSLVIDNLVRRLLTGIKNNNTVHKSARLWQWNFSVKDEKFRLNPNYEVQRFSVNEVSKVNIDPQGININCVKWCEHFETGKLYSFVNNAGLLVVTELG